MTRGNFHGSFSISIKILTTTNNFGLSKAVVYVCVPDGKFEQVAEKKFTYNIKENTFKGFDKEIEFPAQEAVKVKIEFTSGGKIRNGIDCYSPHDKSEVPSMIALDEIEIY